MPPAHANREFFITSSRETENLKLKYHNNYNHRRHSGSSTVTGSILRAQKISFHETVPLRSKHVNLMYKKALTKRAQLPGTISTSSGSG
jgi:hypothetical protein